MKTIQPIRANGRKPTLSWETVASGSGDSVTSFSELQLQVAELSCLYKHYVLYFRGQGFDHKTGSISALYPTIYRGKLYQATYEKRWNDLRKASDLLTKKLKSSSSSSTNLSLLRRKPLLQWSILQHYGVVATPLIDVTQSLRVACSFAQYDCNGSNSEAYVYVVALPYVSHRIHIDSEEYLTVIRLLSIAPPKALRPYYQEGFLVGEDLIHEECRHKKELNLSRRLVAKYRIPAKDDNFWNTESRIDRDILLPNQDEMLDICNAIKMELVISFPKQ